MDMNLVFCVVVSVAISVLFSGLMVVGATSEIMKFILEVANNQLTLHETTSKNVTGIIGILERMNNIGK